MCRESTTQFNALSGGKSGCVHEFAITDLTVSYRYQAARYINNTLIKTTVRNKYLFVLDFIVHYYNMFRPRSVAIFR
jgi:hypothetical protein